VVPAVFVAYAPRGAGLVCALAWLGRGNDLYGWWTGARGGAFESAYFGLENHYGGGEMALYATDNGDPYGGWRYNWSSSDPPLGDPLHVPDDVCHLLEQLQEAFAAEWLWHADDPRAEDERAWYREAELALGPLNLRHRRLAQLDKSQPVWTHYSPRVDRLALDYIARRWPLDYRPE
jgi:hypothetical protein